MKSGHIERLNTLLKELREIDESGNGMLDLHRVFIEQEFVSICKDAGLDENTVKVLLEIGIIS